MKRALLIVGGWDGHKPLEIADRLARELGAAGMAADIETSLEILGDPGHLSGYDVISPNWTMGSLTREQSDGLMGAVRKGCGLAGIHGGVGDAFRGNLEYEWMVGGHFVGHPHVGEYAVRVRDFASPITEGLPGVFPYRSEQYYMLVDPGIHVLADTEYAYEGRSCTMPVAWIKTWGDGRVFYSSLGHAPSEFDEYPHTLSLAVSGLRWAARDLAV